MPKQTKDLSIRIESDGEVLLDQMITIDYSDGSAGTYSYGEGEYGGGPYGGKSAGPVASGFGTGGFGVGVYGD